MKLELCNFSGYKILPGHGKRLIRVDGKVYNFMNGKSQRSYMMRRNPRKTSWTVLYRRKHKKGTQEESVKKRTRRTVKHTRAIQGASLQEILMKRNQKPEVRKAQREQALRAAKAKIAEKKDRQKAVKAQSKQAQMKQGKGTKAKMPKAPRGGR